MLRALLTRSLNEIVLNASYVLCDEDPKGSADIPDLWSASGKHPVWGMNLPDESPWIAINDRGVMACMVQSNEELPSGRTPLSSLAEGDLVAVLARLRASPEYSGATVLLVDRLSDCTLRWATGGDISVVTSPGKHKLIASRPNEVAPASWLDADSRAFEEWVTGGCETVQSIPSYLIEPVPCAHGRPGRQRLIAQCNANFDLGVTEFRLWTCNEFGRIKPELSIRVPVAV